MDGPLVGIIIVAAATAMINRLASWKVARPDVGEILDSDAYECRGSWGTDVVALSGLLISSIIVIVSQAQNETRNPALIVVACLTTSLSGSMLAYLLWRSSRVMNGYAESVLSGLPPLRRIYRRAPILLPGLLLTLLGDLALLVVAAG